MNHLGRSYDVVGCFNWDDGEVRRTRLSWEQLGLEPSALMHVYDFWNRQYLGCWSHGLFVSVPPAGVKVVTLVPAGGHAQLISTSRHITQGWVDLVGYAEDHELRIVSGRSRVPGDEPYELTFAVPRGEPTLALKDFEVTVPDGSTLRVLKRSIQRGQGFCTVTLTLDGRGEFDWCATFEDAGIFKPPVPGPRTPTVALSGFDRRLTASWSSTYEMLAGYQVAVDGQILGYAPLSPVECILPDRILPQEGSSGFTVTVHGVAADGRLSERAGSAVVEPDFPQEIYLSDVDPAVIEQEWGSLGRDRSVEGEPLGIGKQSYTKGLGSHASSRIVYRLGGRYTLFEAQVGPHVLGREAPAHKMAFAVYGDGTLLFESGVIESGAAPVSLQLDITGVNELTLEVLDGGDGIDYDHANWAMARIFR